MTKRATGLTLRAASHSALSDMRLRRGLGAVALPSMLVTPVVAGAFAAAAVGFVNMASSLI